MFLTLTDPKPIDSIEFVLDAQDAMIIAQVREGLARKKYQDAMKDAQFSPGAIAHHIV